MMRVREGLLRKRLRLPPLKLTKGIKARQEAGCCEELIGGFLFYRRI
jgi:hypothetical protein